MFWYLITKISPGKMNPEQRNNLLGLPLLMVPPPIQVPQFVLPEGFDFGPDPFPNLPHVEGLPLRLGLDQEEEDPEMVIEGDLGRMLTLDDVDEYYRYKFSSGRTFADRGYWHSKRIDFFHRIFDAYPVEVRNGEVPYDPNIHHAQTGCYEAQLRRLDELVEQEGERERQRRREYEAEFGEGGPLPQGAPARLRGPVVN